MPKTGTEFTRPLYTYMTPANRRWVIAQARANKMAGYSAFMNRLVSALRTMGKVELETRPMRRRLVTKKRRKAA